MSRLLVVDDQELFPQVVQALLGDEHSVDVAHSAVEALGRIERVAYDAVLTDLQLGPGADGIALIRGARAKDADVPFVVLTGFASVETAVDAMREGAVDYLPKTADREQLRTTVDRAVAHGRMAREVRRLRGEVAEARGVADRPVGRSRRLQEALALAERVAPSDANVLVLGESGTGKELTARLIHRLSGRRDGPFVAFDCSALSPSLLESELFGHEKGAFTGAQRTRRGLFREAQGGTLFLDEIGDIAAEVQNKLLRVIQERVVKPVGGDTFVQIDVRLVAATNKDLGQLVRAGRFREDLYYRLAVVPLELPPLRERLEDLPELVAFLLSRRRGAGAKPVAVSEAALAQLRAHAWPGNVRELENVLERAAILSDGRTIEPHNLPVLGSAPSRAPEPSSLRLAPEPRSLGLAPEPSGFGATAEPRAPLPSFKPWAAGIEPTPPAHLATARAPLEPAPTEGRSLKEQTAELVRRFERQAILDALFAEGGSPTRAARRLQISRASLYLKIKELGIPL
jgi:two-component system response regulator HydG